MSSDAAPDDKKYVKSCRLEWLTLLCKGNDPSNTNCSATWCHNWGCPCVLRRAITRRAGQVELSVSTVDGTHTRVEWYCFDNLTYNNYISVTIGLACLVSIYLKKWHLYYKKLRFESTVLDNKTKYVMAHDANKYARITAHYWIEDKTYIS